MTTKTKAEELAAALENAPTHESQSYVVIGWSSCGEDPLTEAAAELRRLAGVEAVLRAAVDGSRALIAAVTAERDDYLQRLNNLHISAKASRDEADRLAAENETGWAEVKRLSAERDRLAAEVERLREDAERYRWLRSVPTKFTAQAIVNDSPEGMDAAIDAARAKG